jgi:hypothetical protein
MQRFHLMSFYVAGLVGLVALTVWIVSMRRIVTQAKVTVTGSFQSTIHAVTGSSRSSGRWV